MPTLSNLLFIRVCGCIWGLSPPIPSTYPMTPGTRAKPNPELCRLSVFKPLLVNPKRNHLPDCGTCSALKQAATSICSAVRDLAELKLLPGR